MTWLFSNLVRLDQNRKAGSIEMKLICFEFRRVFLLHKRTCGMHSHTAYWTSMPSEYVTSLACRGEHATQSVWCTQRELEKGRTICLPTCCQVPQMERFVRPCCNDLHASVVCGTGRIHIFSFTKHLQMSSCKPQSNTAAHCHT